MKKKSIVTTGLALAIAFGAILTAMIPATSVFAQNETAGNQTGNQTGNQSGNPLGQIGEQIGKMFGGQ